MQLVKERLYQALRWGIHNKKITLEEIRDESPQETVYDNIPALKKMNFRLQMKVVFSRVKDQNFCPENFPDELKKSHALKFNPKIVPKKCQKIQALFFVRL